MFENETELVLAVNHRSLQQTMKILEWLMQLLEKK